jgi:hypothetical protein
MLERLAMENALAYFKNLELTDVKRLLTLTHRENVIKLFMAIIP